MALTNGGSQLILTATDGAVVTVNFAHVNMTDEGSYVFNGEDGAVSIMQNLSAYSDNDGSGASTTLEITTFPSETASTSNNLQQNLSLVPFQEP